MRGQPIVIAISVVAILLGSLLIIQIWSTIEERAGTAIQIQHVQFTNQDTVSYVQNVGTGTLTLHSLSIAETTFQIAASNCRVASEPSTTIVEGATAVITLPHAYHVKVHVKVSCTDGTFIEADWKPHI
jgi:hypothetical protein